MKRIYKYYLTTNGVITKLKGKFERILDIQEQNGNICCWIEVNDELDEIEIELVALGTGWDFPTMEGFSYLRTVQQGEYVWHYYMKNL